MTELESEMYNEAFLETVRVMAGLTTTVLPDLIKEEVLRLTDPFRPDVFNPVSLEYAKARLEELGASAVIQGSLLRASWVVQRDPVIREIWFSVRADWENYNLISAVVWLQLLEEIVAHPVV